MVRSNNSRARALEAAVALITRDGVHAVTYEALATETGLTKSGLLYHFPSRAALLRALHEHVTAGWEEDLVTTAGRPFADTTVDERLAAYLRTDGGPSRAELLLMLEAGRDPEQSAPWEALIERWTPPVDTALDGDAELERVVSLLAADGLWLLETLQDEPLRPALRERLVARLVAPLAERPLR